MGGNQTGGDRKKTERARCDANGTFTSGKKTSISNYSLVTSRLTGMEMEEGKNSSKGGKPRKWREGNGARNSQRCNRSPAERGLGQIP